MSVSNYGTTLKVAGNVVGQVVKLTLPTYESGFVPTTYMSGGRATFIPNRVTKLGNIKLTLNYIQSDIAAIEAHIITGTPAALVIDYTSASGFTDWSFNGFPVLLGEPAAEDRKSVV